MVDTPTFNLPTLAAANAANDPAINTQLRQRIALQMLLSKGKAYPKTLGEGLAAIGDALGDRGIAQLALQQDAAARAGGYTAANKVFPAVPAPPPAQTSEAAPDDTRAVAADDTLSDPVVRQLSLAPTDTPDVTASSADQLATNALPTPPPDASPPPPMTPSSSPVPYVGRNAIAAQLASMMQPATAQGVPQPNPTLSAGSDPSLPPPPSSASAPSPSPAAPGGQLPDQRVAQAAPQSGILSDVRPAPPVPSGIRPAPPLQPPSNDPRSPDFVMSKPVPPQQPQPITMTPDMAKAYAALNGPMGANEYFAEQMKQRIAVEQAKITQQNALNAKDFEARLEIYKSDMGKWQDQQGGLAGRVQTATAAGDVHAKAVQDLQLQQPKVELAQGLGGQDPGDFFKQLTTDKGAATRASNLITQARLAREAIDSGVITGFGANATINWERAKAYFLPGKMGGNSAAEIVDNTERMRAAVAQMYGAALETLKSGQGETRLTPGALDLATKAEAAEPTAQLNTIKFIIDENRRAARRNLDVYEDTVANNLHGNAAKNYAVPSDATEPAPVGEMGPYTKRLLANPNQTFIDAYNSRFGPGGAELEIARERRRRGGQ